MLEKCPTNSDVQQGPPAANRAAYPVARWRNWYTHQLQVLAVARPWRFESSSGHHLFFSEHLKKCIKSAEIQGNWPLDRAGSSRLFSGVPHIFAGLLRAFATTTSGKGPHMPLPETRLRALKPKDKPYKVADDH